MLPVTDREEEKTRQLPVGMNPPWFPNNANQDFGNDSSLSVAGDIWEALVLINFFRQQPAEPPKDNS